MDTKTKIAVTIAVIIIIVVIGGKEIVGMFYSSPSSSSANTNTPITMQTDQTGQNQSAPNITTGSTTPTAMANQLQVEDVVVGTGTAAVAGDQVTVDYVGMLQNGTVFDSSSAHGTSGFTFTLGAGQVIQGWDMGVEGMKVGGKRILIIPPSLGYGNQAVGPIPANSTLVFEVQLLSVN